MNIFSTLLLLSFFGFAAMQSTFALVFPATIGISSPAASNGANDSGPLSATGNSKAIFYFNLAQLSGGTEFNQSTLRLFLPRVPQNGSTISVYKIRGAWDDQAFVYKPQIDYVPLITTPAEQIAPTRVLEIDVTSVIKDWSTAPTGIEGFLVLGTFGESSPNIFPLNFDGATSFGLSASLLVDEQTSPQSTETDPFDQWPASLRSRLTNPVFSVQPRILSNGSMSGIAHGAGSISYQWFKNGIPVPNGNDASLPLETLGSGNYTLRATNGYASVTSLPVTFDAANYIPNFSLIPAGTFQMGDNLDGNTDAPVHNVYVSQFFMAQTELTYGDWNRVKTWADANGYQFDNTGAGIGDNYPVTNVNWYDAVKWCNARSEMEGLVPCYYTSASQAPSAIYRAGNIDLTNEMVDWGANGYRLPTEAEWEKAARGSLVGKRYPKGDTLSSSEANFSYANGGTPTSVAAYVPNTIGIYGMAGNAIEWSWDWYGQNYYVTTEGRSDPRGAYSGLYRTWRGGGATRSADFCAVAKRDLASPNNGSGNDVGFRLARTSKALKPRDITSGLVAYYPFNGNANDESRNGRDGTIVGAVLSTDRFGNQSGYTFPSTGNKIKLPIDHSKFESKFTFSIWLKADAFDNFYPQIACGQSSYLICAGNGPIYPAASVNKISFYQYIQSSDSYYGNIETINPIPTGAWIQVVITGDETNRSLYINGKLNQSVAISPTIQTSQGENIAIGGHISTDEEQFRWQGTLDDVRIYNRALTAKDVSALYNSEVPVKITSQPAIYPDGTITVKAQGGDISYLWYKNGQAIAGGTSASLRLASGSLSSGTYTVRVSNSQSSVSSGSLQYSPTNNPNFHDVVPVAGTNVAFSRYETTVGQWKAFVAETGWSKSTLWNEVSYNPSDNQPVVAISREDASDYCQWLSNKTGKTWRLPSADEWRAADQNFIYPWGNYFLPLVTDGNFSFVNDGFTNSAPVGSFPPNSLGLYDLSGNVWEITTSSAQNGYPVIKGGDFELSNEHQEILYNSFELSQGGPHEGVGFRVVCEMPPDITTGLVAYYPFNRNANDASGNALNGTIIGAVSALNHYGQEGGYRFPDDQQKITLPIGHAQLDGDFTISFWMKAADFSSDGPIVLNGQNGFLSLFSAGAAYAPVGKQGHITFNQTEFPDNPWTRLIAPDFFSNGSIEIGKWVHVTAVRAGLTLKIFINGVQDSSAVGSRAPSTSGDYISVWGTSSNSVIDNLRIYNRALTAKDVAALYDSEAPPLPNPFVGSPLTDGLTAYYSFDGTLKNSVKPEDSAILHGGSLVNDVSLNGNYIEFPSPITTGTHTFSTSVNIFETGVTNTDGESYISIGTGANNRSLLIHVSVGGSSVSGGAGTDMILSDFCEGSIIALALGQTLQGAWVNYTTTVSENSIKVYKNGVLVKSAELSPQTNFESLTQHWFAGMHSWDDGNQWSQRFIGRIDDFTAWTRTLSPSEVGSIYNLLKK